MEKARESFRSLLMLCTAVFAPAPFSLGRARPAEAYAIDNLVGQQYRYRQGNSWWAIFGTKQRVYCCI